MARVHVINKQTTRAAESRQNRIVTFNWIVKDPQHYSSQDTETRSLN